jgi:translation elongation factor EF-Ts
VWCLPTEQPVPPLVGRLADNLAVHYFGTKVLNFTEASIPRELYNSELDKVKKDCEKTIAGKSEELAQKILRGKFMKFLEEHSMEHQRVGFEESDLTIGEYMLNLEKQVNSKQQIIRAHKFGL